MIAFLSAMPQEIAGLRGLRLEAIALAIGMGRRATEAGVAQLLTAHADCALISLGFSGGTQPGLRPRELVLCRRVHWRGDGGKLESVPCHPALLEAARRAAQATSLPWREGEGLTQDRVATSPQEKEALGQRLGVQVVDMESFWVGRAAQERGLPFLSVRAVLDPQEEAVPDLNPFISITGRLLAGEAISYFVLRPQHWPAFFRLSLRSRRAAQALGTWALAFAGQIETQPFVGDSGRSPVSGRVGGI